jgi:class I fructose-bisphosphate aldolase
MVKIDNILRDGKCLLLAYDQGMEHGPTDFNLENCDPNYILKIAKEAGVFTGMVFGGGVAEKYYSTQGSVVSAQVPLVVKLNGKTAFHKGEEPISKQLCSVERAVELGAKAVGYTVYPGSEHEEKMLVELGKIVEEAHKLSLPVIAWMYPRGKHVEGKENTTEVLAYAARLGLEIGADMVKLPYTGDPESFKWVVKNAGKTLVVVQGGTKMKDEAFLEEVREVMSTGAAGMAIGRNVWQSDHPIEIAKKIASVIF